MYDFHYVCVKNKYGDKANLLFTDADSLDYEIESIDLYEDLYENKEMADFSEYSQNPKFYDVTNKK